MAQSKRAQTIENLPHRPASDFKKVGWGEVNRTVQDKGGVVVTNHERPQAVILSLAEYERLQQQAAQSEAQVERTLAELRTRFDQQLSTIRGKGGAKRLRAAMRTPLELRGKLKAGTSF